jgi:replicative superfamily II helicase
VLELTGDITPDIKALQKADVLITTPEKWDGISRNWQHRSYVQQVALVVIDEIHLLGQDRGPVIEVIVSRMRYIAEQTGNNIRFVGLSTALANAKDVADWLGIHKLGLYNFKPSVRPVPIKVFFEGFSEKHYCPRMATMNKPTFKAIQTHSKDHPVLVFVSSRRQTRLTALDLIALCAADQQEKEGYEILEFKRPFLKMDPEEMHHISELI